MKKIISILTVLALILSPAFCVSADSPMGVTKASYTKNLSPSLSYTETGYTNSVGKQAGYAFTLTPGESTKAVAAYGRYIYSRETLSDIMNYSRQKGNDVIAGVSGDVFAIQSGVPCGIMISDGVVLCSNEMARPCIGIKNNGGVVSGVGSVKLSLNFGGYYMPVSSFNKVPEDGGGPYILTSDFSSSTKSLCSCVEIIIKVKGNVKTTNNATINGTVVSTVNGTSNTAIPEGHIAYCIPKSHYYSSYVARVTVGSTCEFKISVSSGFSDAEFVISGEKEILKNGKVTSDASSKTNDARSAVGIAGGKVIFFSCDADGIYGAGINESQLAEHMKSLGCTYAISLASGASVTAAVYSDGNIQTVNHPSRGYERTISNAVLFVNTSKSTAPASLSVSAEAPYILAGGGKTKLYAKAITSGGKELTDQITDLKFTLSGSGGIIGNTYTAGNEGKITISASGVCAGKTVKGSTVITAISRFDSIKAAKTWYTIPLNGYEKIDIKGYLSQIPVSLTAWALKWSYSGATAQNANGNVSACQYGYLDSAFVFHSNGKAGTFKLTGTYGKQSVTVTVRVSKNPITVTDFNSGDAFTTFLNFNKYYTYRYADGKNHTNGMYFVGRNITYKNPLKIGNTVNYISVWVKGTASKPYITLRREDGSSFAVYYTTDKDLSKYSGWRRLKATIPNGEQGGLEIKSLLCSALEMKCTVDDITVNYGTDSPPFCDTASCWAKDKINEMFYMDVLDGTLVNGNRHFYPNNKLSRAEFAKIIVSYYRIDASKYEKTKLDFIDAAKIPSWAVKYVKAAVAEKLMSGSTDKNGIKHFYPHNYITRAEVMSVIGRKLNNAGAELTFSDKINIPAWALDSVKKTVAAKIVSGYPDGTLRPNGNVTRAEVAAMIYMLYEYQY